MPRHYIMMTQFQYILIIFATNKGLIMSKISIQPILPTGLMVCFVIKFVPPRVYFCQILVPLKIFFLPKMLMLRVRFKVLL